MLELTRRELISSAIAAAGLMATSPISSAAAPKTRSSTGRRNSRATLCCVCTN